MSFNKGSTVVDVVSHHSLQVHLGPTEEEQLYHSSVSTGTGLHEGSPAILRNRMRQNSDYHVMNMEQGNDGKCTLAVRYSLSEANDTSINLAY